MAWTYSKREAYGYTPEHYLVIDVDRNTVARVYLWASHASLIAAAPDLLAACKFALSQMEAAGLLCGDVRNAIAKAEGAA